MHTVDLSIVPSPSSEFPFDIEINKLPKVRTNYSFGIMYEFLQLEVKEKVASVPSKKQAIMLNSYPNPAVDRLYVDLNRDFTEGEFRMIDTTGKTHFIQSLRTNHTLIDTNTLPSGVYIIQVDIKRTILPSEGVYKVTCLIISDAVRNNEEGQKL